MTILLLLTLLSPPAHADWRCDGILTSNGSCIGEQRAADDDRLRRLWTALVSRSAMPD
jgi:hypothetical protein